MIDGKICNTLTNTKVNTKLLGNWEKKLKKQKIRILNSFVKTEVGTDSAEHTNIDLINYLLLSSDLIISSLSLSRRYKKEDYL